LGQGVIALDSMAAVEAPSMLPRQEDLDRFFGLQRDLWALLVQARDAERAVEFQTADGAWLRRTVHHRSWTELGWLYLVPLLCGVIPFVVGAGVGVFRWQSAGARYLALASLMALLALGEVSIVTGRLFLLAPWFAEAGQTFVRCTSLVAAWAFAMMMLHYPTPLHRARDWARATGGLLLLLVVLNVLQWPGNQTMRYKLWLVITSASLIGVALWQTLAHRDDPVHRAAARWLAASVVVSFSIAMYAFVVSLVYDSPGVSNSYRWVSVPLLYVGLMVSVGRANLFELERWWVPLCMWYLGGTLVVLIDLGLVALLHVQSGPAITLSVLVMGWLYFPLRQWLLSRLKLSSRPEVLTHVPTLIGAINAGLGGTEAARQAWRQLLQQVYEPQHVVWQESQASSSAQPTAQVADFGRQLWVPDVAAQGRWQLTLAQRGRHLFTQQHADVGSQLWQLLELGLAQQRQTQEAVAQERQRIAADLHDDLGAKLLSLAQAGSHDGTAPLARQALEDMRQSVRGMVGRAVPAEDALADWRAELVGRMNGAGLTVEWDCNDPPPAMVLLPRLHLQLTRILREAVSNLIRHSQARRCRIRLAVSEHRVVLDVEDDGQGFPQGEPLTAGLGLASIERRARKLGGHHQWGTSALGGALVHVEVPVMADDGHRLPSHHAERPDR
jgi:signal transduction histidine kinase